MALYIYFDKEFNYIGAAKGMWIHQIDLGKHCIIYQTEHCDPQDKYMWFNLIDRTTSFKETELTALWSTVTRDFDKFPSKIKTFFLLGGLEIALKEST